MYNRDNILFLTCPIKDIPLLQTFTVIVPLSYQVISRQPLLPLTHPPPQPFPKPHHRTLPSCHPKEQTEIDEITFRSQRRLKYLKPVLLFPVAKRPLYITLTAPVQYDSWLSKLYFF